MARIDGATNLLPDLHLFLYSYIRKEAVLSSQIEGTQSSLSDLLLHESEVTPGVPLEDVSEVSRYVKALTQGVERVRNGEKVTLLLLLDLHRTLLSTGRGSDKYPGQLRTTQNWIGGKTPDNCKFVPPPPSDVKKCLENLVDYWTLSKDHTLIKAALSHLQFETIHPFRDGNGRIGRLLITLLLCRENLISEPLIYLSLYLKENRQEYYQHFQSVRQTGDWEAWLLFFLEGVRYVASSAYELTKKIQHLFEEDKRLIREKGKRKAHSMLELYRALQEVPVLTIMRAEKVLANSISKPTLYVAAEELCKIGILKNTKNEKGVQVFVYERYLALLVE